MCRISQKPVQQGFADCIRLTVRSLSGLRRPDNADRKAWASSPGRLREKHSFSGPAPRPGSRPAPSTPPSVNSTLPHNFSTLILSSKPLRMRVSITPLLLLGLTFFTLLTWYYALDKLLTRYYAEFTHLKRSCRAQANLRALGQLVSGIWYVLTCLICKKSN